MLYLETTKHLDLSLLSIIIFLPRLHDTSPYRFTLADRKLQCLSRTVREIRFFPPVVNGRIFHWEEIPLRKLLSSGREEQRCHNMQINKWYGR